MEENKQLDDEYGLSLTAQDWGCFLASCAAEFCSSQTHSWPFDLNNKLFLFSSVSDQMGTCYC